MQVGGDGKIASWTALHPPVLPVWSEQLPFVATSFGVSAPVCTAVLRYVLPSAVTTIGAVSLPFMRSAALEDTSTWSVRTLRR